jgi:hypothetical protein
MAPTTPKNDITPQDIAECLALLERITERLGSGPKLTPKERMRNIKLRKGGEAIAAALAVLSQQFAVDLPRFPASTMLENLDRARSLGPLRTKLTIALKRVDDVIFESQSEGWEAATMHYSTLKRLSRRDGEMAKLLAPVVAFFAKRHPLVVAAQKAEAERAEVSPQGESAPK